MFREVLPGLHEGGFEGLNGVAGAFLLGLQDEVDSCVGDCGLDAVSLVADDAEDLGGGDDGAGGGDDVEEEGLTADLVEDLGAAALEAGAFAGGHDGDGEVGEKGLRGSGGVHFGNLLMVIGLVKGEDGCILKGRCGMGTFGLGSSSLEGLSGGLSGLTGVVSLEEYMRTSYEPDAEYVGGWIEERATGERDYSALQRQLLLLLSSEESLGVFQCFPELRVQTSVDHFRVPDLCLIRVDAPWERFVRTAPMLCIEVLSPEDTMSRRLVRVREFLAMGVPEVWVFDPETRSVEVCRGTIVAPPAGGTLVVPGTSVSLSVENVFKVLNRR